MNNGEKMKNIQNYNAQKYHRENYEFIEDGIYKTGSEYVTSLSFRQEPEYGEGVAASSISQYPLEDLLDRFYVYVSDFYADLNQEDSQICYLEFASSDIVDIRNLRGIIGQHVYNQNVTRDGAEYSRLVIASV